MARSRVQELADEEAARVEAELADAEPDDDEAAADAEPGEPEPGEPEPGEPEPEPDEEPSAQRMMRLLTAEAERHAAVIAELYGDQFSAFDSCPLCNMLGFVAGPSPKSDAATTRCPDCDGVGQTLTGAAQTAEFVRQCARCLGNGWIPRTDVAAPVPAIASVPPTPEPAGAPVVIPPMPVYDQATNQWLVNGQPVQVPS